MSVFDYDDMDHYRLQCLLILLGLPIMFGGVILCEKHIGGAILMFIVGFVVTFFRIELLFIPSRKDR